MIAKKLILSIGGTAVIFILFINSMSNKVLTNNAIKYKEQLEAEGDTTIVANLKGYSSFKPGDIVKEDTIELINNNEYQVNYYIQVNVTGEEVLAESLNLILYNEQGEILGESNDQGTIVDEIEIPVEANTELTIYPVIMWDNINKNNIKVAGMNVDYEYNITVLEGSEDNIFIVKNTNDLKRALQNLREDTEIRIYPGEYSLESINIKELCLNKNNIKFIGYDNDGQPINTATTSKVNITFMDDMPDETFAMSIKGENIVLSGVNISGGQNNRVIQVLSNNVTIKYCNINGNIEFNGQGEENIVSFNIYGNVISGEISVRNGVGAVGDKSNRKIINNTLIADEAKGCIYFIGKRNNESDLYTIGSVEVENNIFIGDKVYIRATGEIVGGARDLLMYIWSSNLNFFKTIDGNQANISIVRDSGEYGYIYYLEISKY